MEKELEKKRQKTCSSHLLGFPRSYHRTFPLFLFRLELHLSLYQATRKAGSLISSPVATCSDNNQGFELKKEECIWGREATAICDKLREGPTQEGTDKSQLLVTVCKVWAAANDFSEILVIFKLLKL